VHIRYLGRLASRSLLVYVPGGRARFVV